MSWNYDDYKPTIPTDKGIKAKSKRGTFVKNWWATRWIAAMEEVLDRGRLSRGRTYARKGQVLSLQEANGKIIGRVQGSRRSPYKYSIEVLHFSDNEWEKIIEALSQRSVFMAQLLAGEMPKEIEDAFSAVDLSLFPIGRELYQECNCPDWTEVCKHLAAVHYILAERFDADPFLLFRLRGKTKEDILTALGTATLSTEENKDQYPPAPPLTDSIDTFWEIGPELEHFQLQVRAPETPYPVLERLGSPDFMPDASRYLATAYQTVSDEALEVAFSEESEPKTETQ